MATKTTSRRRRARPEGQDEREASGRRVMPLITQVGVVIGVISGAVTLLFLLFPGLTPQRSEPTPDQSASITGVVLNPRITRGQYLDYSDQSKEGFTPQQLAVVGAAAFARVQIVGYRGKTLTLARQVVDAQSGDVVGQARDYRVEPPAEKVTHRWREWVPLQRGRGSYAMVIKVLDETQSAAIACGQTDLFGGLAGSVEATAPKICEGQTAS